MSSELRAKIIHAIQAPGSFSDWAERAADRIIAEIASLNPPATAKLPEGVVVCAMPDGHYHVRGCGWWLLKQGRWEKMTLPTHEYPGEFVSHDDALTAALSAPPVPGESKADYDKKCARCGRVPPVLDLVLCENCDRALTREIDEQAKDDRIAQLEAEVANNAQREIIVLIESFGWKHDGNGHWTHKNFNGPYGYRAAAESTLYRGARVEPTPAEKPDARKVAPNGRAMVRYTRPINGAHYGLDDNGKWWVWCDWLDKPRKWREPEMKDEFAASGKPCTFDGTPITETKPDPLARAVTVGEMLRLAEDYEKRLNLNTTLGESLRAIFTPPQGATNG